LVGRQTETPEVLDHSQFSFIFVVLPVRDSLPAPIQVRHTPCLTEPVSVCLFLSRARGFVRDKIPSASNTPPHAAGLFPDCFLCTHPCKQRCRLAEVMSTLNVKSRQNSKQARKPPSRCLVSIPASRQPPRARSLAVYPAPLAPVALFVRFSVNRLVWSVWVSNEKR
jgi:hypothetical protein